MWYKTTDSDADTDMNLVIVINNPYAIDHGGITMLNSHQLEIVRKVILVIKEVTRIISKNSACISAVITIGKDFGENAEQK